MTWSSAVPRRKTSCICFQSININTAEICLNREGNFGHCIWHNQVSQVPVRKTSSCHNRPQATGVHIQQTTVPNTTTSAEDAVNPTEI